MRRRVVRHFALYLPARAGTAIVAAVSLPLLTRLLSPADFGLLTLAMATLAGGRVLFLWIQHAVVRFYAADDAGSNANRVRTALVINIAASLVLSSVALIGTRWWAPEVPRGLLITGVCVFFARTLYGLLLQILRARLEPGLFTRFSLWEDAGGLMLGCILAYAFGLGPLGVLLGYAGAGFTALPLLWRHALPPGALAGEFSWSELRRLAAFGMPLSLSQGASWALRRIDRFQIQATYGAAAVGAYSVPYLVAQYSITLFSATLRTATVPLTADRWERRGQSEALAMLTAITRMYVLATIPMVAGLYVLARPVLALASGSDQFQDWEIIPWVAAGVFFLGLYQCCVNAVMLAQRTGVVMLSVTIAALVNISLNWWLLPRTSYQVAAVTTFLSYALLALLLGLACRRYVPWTFPWRSAASAFASAVVMVVAVQALRTYFGPFAPLADCMISVPTGVLVYAACLRVTGESTWAEWRAALAAGRGRSVVQADAE